MCLILQAERAANMDEDESWELEEEDMEILQAIRSKKKLMRQQSRLNKSKNSAVMPRKSRQRKMEDVTEHLESVGMETDGVEARGRKRTRSLARNEPEDGAEGMDVDEPTGKRARSQSRLSRSRSRAPSVKPPQAMGLRDKTQQVKVAKLARKAQKKANLMARAGEADRHSGPKLLKHLLAGKSGLGTSRSR